MVRLLAVHGGPGETHHLLRPQCDRLSPAYYDQRQTPATWQEHVADLETQRLALGADQLDLLGFSWGSFLSLLYCAEHPTRVRSLILINVPGSAAKPPEVDFSKLEPELSALPAPHQEFVRAVAPWLANARDALKVTPVSRNEAAAKAVNESLKSVDLLATATKCKPGGHRALVLHGELDPIPHAHARAVADALGAEFVLVANSGHAPFVEQPEFTFAAIERFLRQNPQ